MVYPNIIQTYHHYVTCNTVIACGADFLFAQNNPSTTWQSNTMNAGAYGLYLQNQGIIDQQGNANNPIGNQWLGFSLPNPHTMTDASNSFFSPLFVSLNAAFFPRINAVANNGFPYFTNIPFSPNLFQASGPSYNCNTAPAIIVPNDSTRSVDYIISDSAFTVGYDSVSAYQERSQLIRTYNLDTTTYQGSTNLQSFISNSTNSCWNRYCKIERELFTYNYQNAQNELGLFVPANPMQFEHKQFYKIFLSSRDSVLSYSDSVDLYKLGNSCPNQHGSIVYQARSLYNALYFSNHLFADNCTSSGKSANQNLQNVKLTIDKLISDFDFNVYPNPNSGEFMIYYDGGKNDDCKFELLDVYGRMVENGLLKKNFKEVKFCVPQGVYYLRVFSESRKFFKTISVVIQ